jgi:CTP:molybdopterin cytidylyltransferase MocA
MPMTLVVMAAGRGSRFGGMKQVAEVGPSGEALFDYAVYDAVRCGFEDVLFVVSEDSVAAVEARVLAGCARHVKVGYALQHADGRAKPWGTGHAVLAACAEVEGSFGVINADDFYGQASFAVLARELAADHPDDVLVAFALRETLSPNGGVSRGLCRVEGGFLASITELHDVAPAGGDGAVRCREGVTLTGDELVSTNLWGFRPSFGGVLAEEFRRFRRDHGDDPDAEFLLGDAVASLPAHGGERVRVVPSRERFLGVTYPEDVPAVAAEIEALVHAGTYPASLWD